MAQGTDLGIAHEDFGFSELELGRQHYIGLLSCLDDSGARCTVVCALDTCRLNALVAVWRENSLSYSIRPSRCETPTVCRRLQSRGAWESQAA